MHGIGAGAIALGTLILVGSAVGSLWLAAGEQGFDEPIPVPSGYELRPVNETSGALQHSYLGREVSSPEEGQRVATRLIQDYADGLTTAGWEISVIALDHVVARNPGSDDGIRASARVVEPSQGTLAVEFDVSSLDRARDPSC